MLQLLGIKIIDRIKEAGLTQGVLSSFSDAIVTRLGFHEVTDSVCSREAVIILHLSRNTGRNAALVSALKKIEGIRISECFFGDVAALENNDGSFEALAILAEKGKTSATDLQKVLTSFGCNIRTRLGINESFLGEPAGLIILELAGDNDQKLLLVSHLENLGAGVRRICF